MIKITGFNESTIYLAPDAVAQITEAGPSSQWHGIRCFIKCFDGKIIECRESADDVAARVAAESSS